MVSSSISPVWEYTALPLAFWGAEKISACPLIFDYNMLLGIILFYIKSVFVIPQNPGIGAGGWRDVPPHTGSFNPLSRCPQSLGQGSKVEIRAVASYSC